MSWEKPIKRNVVMEVTLSDNNKYDNDKNIPCNLWIDGHQTEIELTAVKRKENCYHSKLDVQLRNYLNRSISCTNKVATLLKGMLNIIMMMKKM